MTAPTIVVISEYDDLAIASLEPVGEVLDDMLEEGAFDGVTVEIAVEFEKPVTRI